MDEIDEKSLIGNNQDNISSPKGESPNNPQPVSRHYSKVGCPFCQQWFSEQEIAIHTLECQSNPSLGSYSESPPNEFSGPDKPTKFLIDEFGMVHTYDRWVQDQETGENIHVESKKSKKNHSTKSSRMISWAQCPICSHQIKASKLPKHLRKVHGNK